MKEFVGFYRDSFFRLLLPETFRNSQNANCEIKLPSERRKKAKQIIYGNFAVAAFILDVFVY